MVKKPFKGKYLEMKVRVSYDERTDTVHLTSKDKDLLAHRGFHLTLNSGRDAEYTLRALLEEHGLIRKEQSKIIPERAAFTDAINTDRWDKFPFGLLPNEEEAVWNSFLSPSLLIAGHAGSGKSVIQRNIIFHCLRHPENWVFYGIDLKRVELTPYLKFGGPIRGVATTLADALDVVNKAYNELQERYRLMEQENVNYFRDLSNYQLLPAWMVMIDESAMLLSKSPSTEEGKAENSIKEELKHKLSQIVPLGRAAGIHLVMATQTINADVFNRNFTADFDAQIAVGRMDASGSRILLGNDKASQLNRAIKGRGYFQQNGQASDFQGYFAPFDWPYAAGIVSRPQQ